ncbi:MAG: glycosyltransferase [Chloroflexi bacterium]|nr:glycosyltransferase [Chloroflexota bacterium]
MYHVAPVSRKRLEEHAAYAGQHALDAIRALAAPLRGTRVLHLSPSPCGGPAELLHSLVPLLRDLGLEAEWQIARGEPDFGPTARLVDEALHGRRVNWTPAAAERWRQHNARNVLDFDDRYDVVVVHGPQLAGLLAALAERGRAAQGGQWVWRCQVNANSAYPEVWEYLLPAVRRYDACVFAHPVFVPPGLERTLCLVIPPAIDPTSPRNMELPVDTVRALLVCHGLDPERPLVVQVAPLDPAFDPLGAIDVYRRAKAERPDLQLVLAHPLAETAADTWMWFEQALRHAGGDPDVRVLAGRGEAGHLTVNVAQRAASVVFQRSVPAGFALPLFEAQWKGRTVVAGLAGGLPEQIAHGQTGYLASDEAGLAQALVALIADPTRAARLGAAGREAVQQRHLVTHALADELRLLRGLLAGAPLGTGTGVRSHG